MVSIFAEFPSSWPKHQNNCKSKGTSRIAQKLSTMRPVTFDYYIIIKTLASLSEYLNPRVVVYCTCTRVLVYVYMYMYSPAANNSSYCYCMHPSRRFHMQRNTYGQATRGCRMQYGTCTSLLARSSRYMCIDGITFCFRTSMLGANNLSTFRRTKLFNHVSAMVTRQ